MLNPQNMFLNIQDFNNDIREYIAWPQEYVFIGSTRKRVKYDELSQTLFPV